MRKFTGGLIYIVGGVLLGAISAYVATSRAGQDVIEDGSPWTSRTAALDGGMGVYVQDYYLLSGRLPLAAGQLIEASASSDSQGNALTASCDYEITASGALPRWWNLAAVSEGTAAASLQSALVSTAAVREADGSVKIVVSSTPKPGNWLKLEAGKRFTLLYAALPAGGRGSRTSNAFSIRQARC